MADKKKIKIWNGISRLASPTESQELWCGNNIKPNKTIKIRRSESHHTSLDIRQARTHLRTGLICTMCYHTAYYDVCSNHLIFHFWCCHLSSVVIRQFSWKLSFHTSASSLTHFRSHKFFAHIELSSWTKSVYKKRRDIHAYIMQNSNLKCLL